jgi:hypothetical protein
MVATELDITQRKRLGNEHRFLADVGIETLQQVE